MYDIEALSYMGQSIFCDECSKNKQSMLALGTSTSSLEMATTSCIPKFQYFNKVSTSTLHFGVYRNLCLIINGIKEKWDFMSLNKKLSKLRATKNTLKWFIPYIIQSN